MQAASGSLPPLAELYLLAGERLRGLGRSWVQRG
jgi:hypothetical protein